jgi:hypothetical protein
MMNTLEIGPRVHALAEKIAEDALNDEDKAFRLDCFKALSQFFIGMTRISGRKDDEDEGVGMSMIEMRAKIAKAGNVPESPLLAHSDCNGRFE